VQTSIESVPFDAVDALSGRFWTSVLDSGSTSDKAHVDDLVVLLLRQRERHEAAHRQGPFPS
jgi:hypothetical protein